jgi:hypothetical protein
MSGRKDNKSTYCGNGGISNNYDPDRILDKVNNHFTANSPNFNLMTSRPTSNVGDPLPFYMKVRIINYYDLLYQHNTLKEYFHTSVRTYHNRKNE